MKNTLRFLQFVTALAILPITAKADGEGILADIGKSKPKISLSNVYSERVKVERRGKTTTPSVIVSPEKISATITVNVTGLDPYTVSPATTIWLNAGKCWISRRLSDDPSYSVGNQMVRFPFTQLVQLPDGTTKSVSLGSMVCSWNKKTVTFRLTCRDIVAAQLSDIASSDYIGQAEAGTAVEIFNAPVEVSMSFGGYAGSRTAYLRGIAKTEITKLRSALPDGTDELQVESVNLKGLRDVVE